MSAKRPLNSGVVSVGVRPAGWEVRTRVGPGTGGRARGGSSGAGEEPQLGSGLGVCEYEGKICGV